MKKLGVYTTPSGQKIAIRLIEKTDTDLLVEMFEKLSPESRRLRFQLYTARIPEERMRQEAKALTDCDPQRHLAVVATITGDDSQEHAVGVAHFARATPKATDAEVAIVVRDDFQRKGLGKHLLRTLANIARQRGVTHFTAWILAENIRLMKLVKGMELKDVESETRHGEQKIRVPLEAQVPEKQGCWLALSPRQWLGSKLFFGKHKQESSG
ncbi:MAG: GNAT family N-acetyltransferase [Anaerolineae bacterium]|nr:GNAT family N-acetyltransferase [Anaerolineae bacterium]